MDDAVQDDSDHVLPPMKEGDRVKLIGVVPSQHFTEPPPRFSEASLVKALEEYGIGRPSTYASIISTLRDRQYVEIESRRFTATDIGKIVSRFLTQYFTTYVDYDFTAKMEDSLDAVASGEQEWVPLLERFWKPFIDLVKHTEKSVSREEVAQARDLGADPVSGKPMSVRMGRFGPFVQIGTKDDADKPRFAGLRPGQKMDQITHAQALELFKLPRKLGTTAAGEEITTNVGRFGPYVKYGAKYVSLKTDDPVRDHAGARARGDSRKGNCGCQSADSGFSGRRHPGAERPLRTLHHRQGAQREDPEGQGPEEPDPGGMPGAAGGGTRTRQVGAQGREGLEVCRKDTRQGRQIGAGHGRGSRARARWPPVKLAAQGQKGRPSTNRRRSKPAAARQRPRPRPSDGQEEACEKEALRSLTEH